MAVLSVVEMVASTAVVKAALMVSLKAAKLVANWAALTAAM